MKFVSSLMKTMIVAAASGSVTMTKAQLTQGLRVEVLHDSSHKGICTEAFYSAVEKQLFDFAASTASATLHPHGLSADKFVTAPFHLGSVNVRQRARNLLRGTLDEVQHDQDEPQLQLEDNEGEDRSLKATVNQASSTCTACTKSSCSAYCTGCYLCQASRRSLSKASSAVLTSEILREAEAALQKNIGTHFSAWLASGPGAALAMGCLGDPKKVKITINLV